MWSSFMRTKSEVLDMPVRKCELANSTTLLEKLTREHLLLDLLLTLSEEEELETIKDVS